LASWRTSATLRTRAISARALTSAAVLGCLLYALGWSWMGFARGWALLAGAMTVVTLGEIVVSPSLQALAANLAPDQVRGRYIGFHGLMTQLGMALGPLLGGISAEQLGGRWVPAPWLAVGALAAFTGWGFSRLGRHLRPAEQGLHPLGVL
ncbi:MAG: MFS transporter, partial [Elusimicrobiota bacterium]